MKNLLVFTALAFGVATSHQALACDWMHEANQDLDHCCYVCEWQV